MVLWIFWAAATQNHSQGGATVLYYVHFGMTVISLMVFYFIPNSRTDFRCTISLYCERSNLLFSTFLVHSIWWNGLDRPILQRNLWYFVRWCCHLGNQFTTPSLVLGVVKHLDYNHAQVHITLIYCIDWVVIFLRSKQLLSSRLSHRNSVRPSVCLSLRLSVRPSHGWNDIYRA